MAPKRRSMGLFLLFLLMSLASFAGVIYLGTSTTGFATLSVVHESCGHPCATDFDCQDSCGSCAYSDAHGRNVCQALPKE